MPTALEQFLAQNRIRKSSEKFLQCDITVIIRQVFSLVTYFVNVIYQFPGSSWFMSNFVICFINKCVCSMAIRKPSHIETHVWPVLTIGNGKFLLGMTEKKSSPMGDDNWLKDRTLRYRHLYFCLIQQLCYHLANKRTCFIKHFFSIPINIFFLTLIENILQQREMLIV